MQARLSVAQLEAESRDITASILELEKYAKEKQLALFRLRTAQAQIQSLAAQLSASEACSSAPPPPPIASPAQPAWPWLHIFQLLAALCIVLFFLL